MPPKDSLARGIAEVALLTVLLCALVVAFFGALWVVGVFS